MEGVWGVSSPAALRSMADILACLQNEELCNSLKARAEKIGGMGPEEMDMHQEELGSVQMLLDSFRTGCTAGGSLVPESIARDRGPVGASEKKAPLLLM